MCHKITRNQKQLASLFFFFSFPVGGGCCSTSLWTYTLSTQAWAVLSNKAPVKLGNPHLIRTNDNKILVLGGFTDGKYWVLESKGLIMSLTAVYLKKNNNLHFFLCNTLYQDGNTSCRDSSTQFNRNLQWNTSNAFTSFSNACANQQERLF